MQLFICTLDHKINFCIKEYASFYSINVFNCFNIVSLLELSIIITIPKSLTLLSQRVVSTNGKV